jgi:NADH-quinone oxidoreductase subunit M
MIHLLILIPLLFGLTALFSKGRGVLGLATLATFATLAAALVLALATPLGLEGDFFARSAKIPWLPALGINYAVHFDGVSLLLALVVALMTLCGVIYAGYRIEEAQLPGFLGLVLLMEAGLLGIFAARNLVLFYVFFEATLIPSLFLLGLYGRERRMPAATKFAIFTVFGGLMMLAAIIGVKAYSGAVTFDLADILAKLKTTPLPIEAQTWIFWGFLIGFAVKLPLFPLHSWLPDFHSENHPSGVADLMGTLYKVGAYGIFRFALPLCPEAAHNAQGILLFLAGFTALYAAWIAFAQYDFKRLLAYAGLSHMGLIGLGLFSLHPVGITGALYLLAFQGVYTGALFLASGMIQERFYLIELDAKADKKSDAERIARSLEIGRWRGLAAQAPAFAGLLLVLWFASIGVPGMAGFIGEVSIFVGVYQTSPWAAFLGLLTTVAAAAFALTAYQRVWYEAPSEKIQFPELRNYEYALLVPLVAVLVIFGVYSTPALNMLKPGVAALANNGVFASSLNQSLQSAQRPSINSEVKR